MRLVPESSLRYAQHAIASECQRGVPDTVALERGTGVMKGVSVELDHQPLPGPEHIHLQPGHEHVDQRWGQMGITADSKEAAFEVRARIGHGRTLLGDQVTERARASPPRAAPQQHPERTEIQDTQTLRRIESTLEVVAVQYVSEIEQRAGDRGHRNPLANRPVIVVKSAHPVKGYSGAAAARSWRNHFDIDARARTKSAQGGSAAMAQHCA